MKQERFDILSETVNNLHSFFQFQTTYDVTVDEMGLVMRGTSSPDFISQRLDDLVKEHGFTYVKGEVAEVLQKDLGTRVLLHPA